jgi:hypothetical protein
VENAQSEDFYGAFSTLFLSDLRSVGIITARRRVLKEGQMEKADTVIAVFADHQTAERAVKELTASGFEMKNLSVVGKGYHTEEKVVGFFNIGDRVQFWGARGAFWGGLWGLFFGGLFISVPIIGHVVVLGYLAAVAVSAAESALLVGGLSALGAALYSIGIPKDSVIEYEAAVKADGFLVMARGTAAEVARAQAILHTIEPSRLDMHTGVSPTELADHFSAANHLPDFAAPPPITRDQGDDHKYFPMVY